MADSVLVKGVVRAAGVVSLVPLGEWGLALFILEAPRHTVEAFLTSAAGLVLWVSSEIDWRYKKQ
ncbi:hypothetical protein Tamer19_22800 [Cupriavidus sp. TA19]|uniref:hypothetical protein n=1 Tax=unclassified Cupriavidus TaxID=2640874 RepID=UPI000E2FBA35|nr:MULTISPECIES: hypothetical protein [unclassified Cupriavidus]BDB28756.1 hypothetical protein CTP10_R61680 [Cupriavidus sp. P-10]GLC92872.1 hypothetical protein Tamer19_22800 [Cupriavidus sp. TA19]